MTYWKINLPKWWNGRHAGLRNQYFNVCGFESHLRYKNTMLGSPVVTSRVSRPQESSKKRKMGSPRLKCFTRTLSSVGSEHLPYKQGVNGSNPLGCTKIHRSKRRDSGGLLLSTVTMYLFYGGCSSEEEHLIVVQDVVGSSPIIHPKGPLSEWLGVGLQNRLHWFESSRDLKIALWCNWQHV